MQIHEKVNRIIDNFRPMLQSDDGDIELVEIKDNKVYYKLTGSCRGCPSSHPILNRGITVLIRREIPEIEAALEILSDGTLRGWEDKKNSKDPWVFRQRIEGIKLTLAIASGKGGVGKSTVAVNLALALQKKGLRVGILDADIYGPSTPTMLGVYKIKQSPTDTFFHPAIAYDMKVMSIGFFLTDDSAVIWRGPMVTKMIDQFIHNVDWGVIDCLVIDLPPGTGDAQLTISQRMPIDGVIIVTTPSDVALIDARRGLKMFEKISIPVLGIVENMSYFLCPHCGERTDIFSAGGGKEVAEKLNTSLFGEIPLDPMIRRTGDHGKPVVEAEPNSPQAKHFTKVADSAWDMLTRLVPSWNKNGCHTLDQLPVTLKSV